MIPPLLNSIANDKYPELYNSLNEDKQVVSDYCYYYNEQTDDYKTYDWINENVRRDPYKTYKQNFIKIYKVNQINYIRTQLRIRFLDITVEEGNIFKWKRYKELH